MPPDPVAAAPAASAPTAPAAPAPAAPAPALAAPPAPAAPAPAEPAAAPAAEPAAAPAPAEPAKPAGAPEKYEFAPTEGLTLNPEVIGKFSEVAKALNLTQEGAQKMLTEVAPAIAAQQTAAFEALKASWANEAKAAPDIGGTNFDQNLGLAKRGIETYFSPDFVKLLDSSGLGNHPEMLRGFMKIGKTVSQDTFVSGGSGQTPNASQAERLYGKS